MIVFPLISFNGIFSKGRVALVNLKKTLLHCFIVIYLFIFNEHLSLAVINCCLHVI